MSVERLSTNASPQKAIKMGREMKIERKFATASHHTFTIKPIAELLSRYIPPEEEGGLTHSQERIAPQNLPMTIIQ